MLQFSDANNLQILLAGRELAAHRRRQIFELYYPKPREMAR